MVRWCVFGRACCSLGVGSTKTEDLHRLGCVLSPFGMKGNPYGHPTVHDIILDCTFVLLILNQRPVNLSDALERVNGPESPCRTQETLYYVVLNL